MALRATLAATAALVVGLLAAVPANAAAPWSSAVDLSPPGQSIFFPQVGIDSNGEATAAFDCLNPACGPATVFRAARPHGGTWTGPQAANSGEATYVPQVSVAPNGFAGLIWWRGGEKAEHIIQTASRSGGVWSGVTNLTDQKEQEEKGWNGSYFPHIAVNSKGDQVAIWQECFSSTDEKCTTGGPFTELKGEYVLKASMKMAGAAGWSPAVELSDKTETAIKARVAISEGGTIAIVWEADELPLNHEGLSSKVVNAVVRRPSDSGWGNFKQLSPVGKEGGEPEIEFDGAGNATALWHSRLPTMPLGGVLFVESSVLPAGGATNWSSPVQVSTGESTFEPQLAVNSAGTAVAIWRENSFGLADIKGAMRIGGNWSSEVNISAQDIGAAEPRVGIDSAGDAVAIWSYNNAGKRVIQGSLLPAGGSWGSPGDLSLPGQEAEEPAVAMSAKGDAVAVWQRFDGSNQRAQAATIDASVSLTSSSIPKNGGVGKKVSFSASASNTPWGGLHITWNFGDGKTAVGNSVSHTYAKAGKYKVTVTASDGPGNTASASGTVTVKAGVAKVPKTLKVQGNKVFVPVTCNNVGNCKGQLKLVKGAGKRKTVLGRANFSLAAGKKRTFRVPLTKKGKSLLKAAKKGKLNATLEGSGLQKRGVTLQIVAPKKGKGK